MSQSIAVITARDAETRNRSLDALCRPMNLSELLEECARLRSDKEGIPLELLRRGVEITDANAAIFDAAHNFAGCIAGIHEVLRRQGLLEGVWTLDPKGGLSPGQRAEIERVYAAYPHLNDDRFVKRHREAWLDRG